MGGSYVRKEGSTDRKPALQIIREVMRRENHC